MSVVTNSMMAVRPNVCGAGRGVVWALVLGGLAFPPPALAQTSPQTLPDALRNRVEAAQATGYIAVADRPLRAVRALPQFYGRNGFVPVWVSSEGRVRTAELVATLRGAENDGLDPVDYRSDELEERLRARASGPQGTADLVDLELLLTDAFLVYGSHLLQGRVNPETLEPEWLANRRDVDMAAVLEEALAGDSVQASLEALAPPQPRYQRLKEALARLRALDSTATWDPIPAGDKLELGVQDPRVELVRRRLAALGDLPVDASAPADAATFDAALDSAARRFQARNGLADDGVVGPGTLAALNRTPRERARQVAINMERFRWLPNDLGRSHIEVNIAGFEVTVVADGAVTRKHRAVVGRQYRQTPIFSGVMTYMVLSPYWHVPPSIAAVDKLPLIKQNPGYLAAQRMTLLTQGGNQPVDPFTVDWTSMTGAELNLRFRIRQDPGPQNALGTVKFMFPNRYNVYLHDTPSRELFAQAARGFSSGCIRVQDPLDLAEFLLRNDPAWNRARIDAVVAAGTEQTVHLAVPLPVHLLYWTAWVDEDGTVSFRDDIYGRDDVVWSALVADPPGS